MCTSPVWTTVYVQLTDVSFNYFHSNRKSGQRTANILVISIRLFLFFLFSFFFVIWFTLEEWASLCCLQNSCIQYFFFKWRYINLWSLACNKRPIFFIHFMLGVWMSVCAQAAFISWGGWYFYPLATFTSFLLFRFLVWLFDIIGCRGNIRYGSDEWTHYSDERFTYHSNDNIISMDYFWAA